MSLDPIEDQTDGVQDWSRHRSSRPSRRSIVSVGHGVPVPAEANGFHPHGTRPLERAQVLWQHARQLADPRAQPDRPAAMLELLRTARHDPTEMAHALALGQTHLRGNADDAQARDGVNILERAITFLGVKPNHIRPAG